MSLRGDAQRAMLRELVLDRVFASSAPRTKRIDRYRILRHLGAGGMGSVWVAYDERLAREVAIKLVRGAEASEKSTERLAREAQALAALSHPNVVQVYGMGRHEGCVYVVMELVVGESLAKWLRQPRSWRAVLDVMTQVARGLAAAHAAGIVHRDLKPDNIVLDERGRPRIIDFGLARVLTRETTRTPTPSTSSSESSESSKPSPPSPLTRTGTAVGTPLYMAPEQLAGRVTPATDQFAFCVTLYEALYGQRPFQGEDQEQLTGAICKGPRPAPVEGRSVPSWLHRVVVRGLAVRPSDRWPSLAVLAEQLERERPLRARGKWLLIGGGIALAALALASMPRRIDPCVGVADELDPVWDEGRRSLSEVAARIGAGEPSVAGFEAWVGQWKDARVGACRGSTPARAAQSDAQIACLRDAASELEARLDARPEDERDTGRWLMSFDPSALPAIGPCAVGRVGAAHGDPRARELLARARGLQHADALTEAARVARQALAQAVRAGDPTREAAVRLLLGELLRSQDDFEAARRELLGAYEQAVALRGESDEAATIELDAALELVRLASITDDFDEASTWLRHAEAVWERGRLSRRQRVQLLRRRALLLRDRGELEPAKAAAREALGEAKAVDDAALIAAVQAELAAIARKRGQLDEALEHYQQALAVEQRRLGERHSVVGHMLSNLGATERLLGRLDDAGAHQARALEILTGVYGEHHSALADVHTNLGLVAFDQHDAPRARRHYERALELLTAAHGDDAKSAVVWVNLGAVTFMEGDLEGSMRASKRALAGIERDHGEGHVDTAPVLANLGVIAYSQGRLDEAMGYLLRARRVLESIEGVDPMRFADIDVNMGLIALESGDHDTARRQLEQAREVFERELGPDNPRVAIVSHNLCIDALAQGRYASAAPECARAREIHAHNEDVVGLADVAVAEARLALGEGRREEGLRGLREAIAELEREQGPEHRELYDALLPYGRALLAAGRASPADEVLARAHAIATAEADERRQRESGILWARAQWQLGRRAQAVLTFEAATASLDAADVFGARASAWLAHPRSQPPLTEALESAPP